jgi:hypothetical protein
VWCKWSAMWYLHPVAFSTPLHTHLPAPQVAQSWLCVVLLPEAFIPAQAHNCCRPGSAQPRAQHTLSGWLLSSRCLIFCTSCPSACAVVAPTLHAACFWPISAFAVVYGLLCCLLVCWRLLLIQPSTSCQECVVVRRLVFGRGAGAPSCPLGAGPTI